MSTQASGPEGASAPATRVQLCGQFVVRVDGVRVEDRLPGRQGRQLFAYLVAKPHRSATRDELLEALWPHELPAAPGTALSALVSKLRRVLGGQSLEGRSEVRLRLADDAFVDVQAARHSVHAAESLVTASRWWDAYPHAVVAGAIARREFLRGEQAPWIEDVRSELSEVALRAIECTARICLGVGGTELPTAEQLARDLTRRAPYRESGYALLMQALAGRGRSAEALQVYADLQERLRDELGAVPSAEIQAVHARLLRGGPWA